jgi:hypothetical protein
LFSRGRGNYPGGNYQANSGILYIVKIFFFSKKELKNVLPILPTTQHPQKLHRTIRKAINIEGTTKKRIVSQTVEYVSECRRCPQSSYKFFVFYNCLSDFDAYALEFLQIIVFYICEFHNHTIRDSENRPMADFLCVVFNLKIYYLCRIHVSEISL